MKALGVSLAALAAVGVGCAVGFAWGQSTRSAIGDNTETDFSGGVLTVKVNTLKAASAGLRSLF